MPSVHASETQRLEELWRGDFGNAYIDRNRNAGEKREPFWQSLLAEFPINRVLEVGCNTGTNLQWIAKNKPPHQIYGVDINAKALSELHRSLPEVNALYAPAKELPFRENWFDLVFTMGVLIHQPPGGLPDVLSEIVRCSNRYILCGEYYAEELTEVPYRDQSGALFKQDYGGLYQKLFPNLKLLKQGFLSKTEGWDDITFWIFEKA